MNNDTKETVKLLSKMVFCLGVLGGLFFFLIDKIMLFTARFR